MAKKYNVKTTEDEPIEVRAHHILIAHYPNTDEFIEKIRPGAIKAGYTPKTLKKVKYIVDLIQNENARIKVVEGPDYICKGCKAMNNPKNKKNTLDCSTNVNKYDEEVIEQLGFIRNGVYTPEQIKNILEKHKEYVEKQLREMLKEAEEIKEETE